MADLSQHRRTPAELEALTAAVQRIGLTFAKIESALPGFLARAAERELKKAYSRQPPAWRPLTSRTDPTHFGRKRRARRARGRRIDARRTTPAQIFHSTPEGSGALTVERWAGAQRLMRSHCADAARYLDPSLGEPWEEQADEADQDSR
jgi:hypothetical protein